MSILPKWICKIWKPLKLAQTGLNLTWMWVANFLVNKFWNSYYPVFWYTLKQMGCVRVNIIYIIFKNITESFLPKTLVGKGYHRFKKMWCWGIKLGAFRGIKFEEIEILATHLKKISTFTWSFYEGVLTELCLYMEQVTYKHRTYS